jgi:hypothetical protein
LRLGMSGSVTVFADNAGVIGLLMSILVWISSYARFCEASMPPLEGKVLSYAFADRSWSALMNRRVTTVIIAATALCLGVASAHAGPCSSEIAKFEQAVRQSAGNPGAGPMAPQSIGAQLDRQPTPGSVQRAEERAQAAFAATLARAKRLDARGNRAGCTRALAAAKRMYNLQ